MKILMGICHSLVRNGLGAVLRRTCPDAALDIAESFTGLQERLANNTVQLLVVDLHLPGLDRTTGLRQLREAYPNLKILVHADEEDRTVVLECLAAGVNGYANFALSIEQLQRGIELVMAGEIYVPPALAQMRSRAATVRLQPGRDANLTPQQSNASRLLAKGHNKEIPHLLGSAPGTTKGYVAAVELAFGNNSRLDAVMQFKAAQRQLLYVH